MDKKITLDIVDEAYNIINFEKYKLNFHNELFNVKKSYWRGKLQRFKF